MKLTVQDIKSDLAIDDAASLSAQTITGVDAMDKFIDSSSINPLQKIKSDIYEAQNIGKKTMIATL
ncbi:hypothetical protein [Liquorilactobacillus satsumensis]|uniref:hypothetical protein n=1 Tax=Liquorilactobacillus satsumensis TaxID=259059 RepID=UPI0039EAF638